MSIGLVKKRSVKYNSFKHRFSATCVHFKYSTPYIVDKQQACGLKGKVSVKRVLSVSPLSYRVVVGIPTRY